MTQRLKNKSEWRGSSGTSALGGKLPLASANNGSKAAFDTRPQVGLREVKPILASGGQASR